MANESTVIRASSMAYVIFLAIWGVVAFIGACVTLKSGVWSFPVLWIGLGGMVISIILLTRYRISWDDRRLTYRSVLSTSSVPFSNITRFDVRGPQDSRFDPTIALYVYSGARPAMVINLKLFSRADVQQLVVRLRDAVALDGRTAG